MSSPEIPVATVVTPRLRDALTAVPAYRAGKPATVVEGVTAYKLSSNENPYPPLPSVLEAAREALGEMNRYPDVALTELRGHLSADLAVTPEEIIVGAGSSGVLGQIVLAAVAEGSAVVYAWRSFELYPIVIGLAGGRSVQVPLRPDGRHDLVAMARAVTRETSLLIVCSPNNPTGPAVTEAELRGLLETVPPHVLVVLDEAYVEFVVDPAAPDAMAVYADHPNLVVLRTFSKAYGLAGLRVGYCIAHPRVAEELRKTSMPFVVTAPAERAAMASLRARDELEVRVKGLVGERTRVLDELRHQGYAVPDSQANFVWLPLGGDALAFAEAADRVALSVRAFDGDGVRCSVDEPAANDRLLEVTAAFRTRRDSRAN